MKPKITLREFDKIHHNIINDYNFNIQELITFIEEFSSSQGQEDAYTFMNIKRNREFGEYVTIRNYVGLIQLKSGFQIEILPKIYMASEVEEKRIFIRMLKSMKDFDGKIFNFSNLNVENMKLYEIFINLYLQETDRIIKKGLKSAYISLEDNLKVLKGKLLIEDNIRSNMVHKEKFYLKYDEFHNNCVENRLIKATLLKLYLESENDDNKKKCKQLLSHFDSINESMNYDADLSKVVIDKNHREYELLMNWSKIILKNNSFSTFSGNSKSRALLFKMDSLFERFVAKELKKASIDKDWIVKAQTKVEYLFDEPKRFRLKPDIVVESSERKVILDTKWKELIDDDSKNYNIAQDDMYQMYAYSKKSDNSPVILIYPLNVNMLKYKDTGVSYTSIFDKVIIHVFFIDLINMEESINKLISKIEELIII